MSDEVAGHVHRFNTAVRGGDWEQFGAGFAPDATVDFDGATVPPMAGRAAIVDGYHAMPPDDTLTVLSTELDGERVIATFAWDAEPGIAAGAFVIGAAGGLITRLTVRLGAPAAR
ncbi:MAG: nuclear transport factor 2 family protein [Actinomycetes bacterium]